MNKPVYALSETEILLTNILYEGGNNMNAIAVGRRLRELRQRENLTQDNVAAILGCSQPTYYMYESGMHILPTNRLFLLAQYYQVSADYIIGLSDKP